LARGGADGRDGRHNTFGDGRKWPKLLHMAKKNLKKHKENKEKKKTRKKKKKIGGGPLRMVLLKIK
jgi:hypothetical protein